MNQLIGHPQSLKLTTVLLLVLSIGCSNRNDPLKLELENSFANFARSIRKPVEDNLRKTVFFPETSDYKQHVMDLSLKYLEKIQAGEDVDFDPQGVILVRYLGLDQHRHSVLKYELSEDGNTAGMRISVHFSFDSNIKYSGFEDGTKVFIPGKPFGSVYVITIGAANEAPREQLSYIEIEVEFRRTNMAGQWQVRSCKADPETAKYVVSFESH